jgi:hypothetical protein
MWAEDADVLIMLLQHNSSTIHPTFFITSKGSYDVPERLSEKERGSTCFSVLPSLAVVQFLQLPVTEKRLYSTGFKRRTLINT